MLANMIDIHSSADTPLLDWSVPSVSELPTGTVTLLLADVEGSTRLWETQSDTMTTALEQLNQTVNDFVAAHVAAGDAEAAKQACGAAWRNTYPLKELLTRCMVAMADAALCCGDLVAARRWADDTVVAAPGFHQMLALIARARVAVAQGEPQQAETDLHEALAVAERTGGYRASPTPWVLAALAADTNPAHAARLLGAADSMRQRHGEVRFKVFQAD